MEPLEQGELRTAILALAEKADFDMKDIFVIDGSKRSSHSNAFFTGFGPSKRICLFDTLISQQSTDEIVAVLGHEIGHYKKGHIYIGMVLSFLETFLMLYLLSIFISNPDLAAAFYVSEPSAYFGLIAFGMLLTPIQTVLGVVGNIISRMNEYSADKYGAELTGKCLFDTLISQQSTDEIVAVLGHEIGHYKKGHIYIGMVLSFLEIFLMLYLLSIFISNPDLAAAFYVSEPSAYFGLIAFGMLLTPIQTVLGVVGNIISRMNEYSADKYGAELTGKPKDLILSLKKLSKDNLSNLTPHPFSVFIGYSHPPVLMRVRALNDLESHDSTLV
eukprot:CAMPEP_0204843852 /NCGR_PEP_ID=MMETSP1346-20131115/48225_1 /ASSEMBLY_ACC=CAM_ASM_000771 /TAXON_ID=215587 /ORGANISM="Aplanochytrium stocchinoi, Strain GSBS06" /LENGTH=329 /DNA_ID=CAMNT_0051983073 /DNA_START=697 /DNA_END=1686 /DNA_ORIENTATION=-